MKKQHNLLGIRLKLLGSRLMLLLGEVLIRFEQRTKRGLHAYLIFTVLIALVAWGFAYVLFKRAPDVASLSQEPVPVATEAPAVTSPPRYLFFNDYYFFERELDLGADKDLILTPERNPQFDAEAYAKEFLEQDLFSKDKQFIDEELARLAR